MFNIRAYGRYANKLFLLADWVQVYIGLSSETDLLQPTLHSLKAAKPSEFARK